MSTDTETAKRVVFTPRNNQLAQLAKHTPRARAKIAARKQFLILIIGPFSFVLILPGVAFLPANLAMLKIAFIFNIGGFLCFELVPFGRCGR